VTAAANEGLEALLHSGDRSAWATAALVIALDGGGPPERRAAAEEVLRALGSTPQTATVPWTAAAWPLRRLPRCSRPRPC
jgi:hypothetical protein